MIKNTENVQNKLSFINQDIEHVQQIKNYDCGVACLRMGLKYDLKKNCFSKININSY